MSSNRENPPANTDIYYLFPTSCWSGNLQTLNKLNESPLLLRGEGGLICRHRRDPRLEQTKPSPANTDISLEPVICKPMTRETNLPCSNATTERNESPLLSGTSITQNSFLVKSIFIPLLKAGIQLPYSLGLGK